MKKISRRLNSVFTVDSVNSDTQWINRILRLVKKKEKKTLQSLFLIAVYEN